eukprot:scaffold429348_cov39-Prasinocladus_malaysianus.AAC.1
MTSWRLPFRTDLMCSAKADLMLLGMLMMKPLVQPIEKRGHCKHDQTGEDFYSMTPSAASDF